MAKEKPTTGTAVAQDPHTLPLDLEGLVMERELTTKEANKMIREETRLEKAKEKSHARSAGTARGVLALVQKKHPHDPYRQLNMFLGNYVIKAGTGRKRPVSQRTNDWYHEALGLMIRDLKLNGMPIRNLGEFNSPHVLCLARYWIAQGQAPSTVQNKLCIARRFLTFIGRENAVPRSYALREWLNKNGIEAPNWTGTVAKESKAWSENGVDLHQVLAQMNQVSPITGIQLEMQAGFGLRVKESIMINPKAADGGHYLRVVHGTKGGLPRDVAFDEDPVVREWQRDLLERAKLYASQNPKGTLSTPKRSLEQLKDHFYYQCSKLKISRSGLGITPHGLRHEFAARRYAHLSGMGAPVTRDAPLEINDAVRQADFDARLSVSHDLGHFRPDVTKAYVGSLPMLQKQRKQRISSWLQRTEENEAFQTVMREAGIQDAWLGGRFALGLEIDSNEKLRLIVRSPGNRSMNVSQRDKVKQALAQIYSRGVDLSEQLDESTPDDSLLIVLR